MALNSEKSRRMGGIIATHERKKEFDAAVKEVMRQRKAAQNFQNAVRQAQKKQNRPSLQQQASGTRQLDTSRRAHAVRRATVADGGSKDLMDLQKLRAAHRDMNNAAAARGPVPPTTTAKVRHHRSSTGDISDGPSALMRKNSGSQERDGRRAAPRNSRNSLAASMSVTDGLKQEVIQAMNNKKEGGGPTTYVPMRSRTSAPLLSSRQSDDVVTEKTPPRQRNDSWTLSQDPGCGIPGIRLEDLVPTRSNNVIPTSSSGSYTNENRGLDDSEKSREETIRQWKAKTLQLYPPQIDFDLGKSSPPQYEKKSSSSGEVKSSPSPPPPSSVAVDHDYDNDKDCPRKKFALISSGGGSKSGGTGDTSRGSIFSSTGSVNNSNPAMVPPSVAAIEEVGKHPRPREADEHSTQSGASKFSLQSIRSRATRRSKRLSQIRKSIRSLTGNGDDVPTVVNGGGDDQVSDVGDTPQRRLTVDTDKVRRHFLERGTSTHSITSAYSTVSQTSASKNENTQPGWRFRLSKGGFRNQSMSALSSVDRRRGSMGSGRSIGGDSSSGCSFTEFYDNELHTGLIRSIIRQTSTASLGLSLPTVDEGIQHREQTIKVEEKVEEEVTIDDILASTKIDASEKSDDTAQSFYRHPSHEHPLLHLRPNQLFPHSPGWQCDLCMQDTVDLNEWAYVSTGQNYLLCERCFSRDGELLAN